MTKHFQDVHCKILRAFFFLQPVSTYTLYTAFLDFRCTMNKKQCKQYLECKSFVLFLN